MRDEDKTREQLIVELDALRQRTADLEEVERELLATRNRLERFLCFSPAVTYSCKPSGDHDVTFVSSNITDRIGYEPREFIEDARFWIDHVHPEDTQRIAADIPALFKKGRHTHQYRLQHKDGSWRWMHDDLMLLRDSNGNPVEIVGFTLDITERKRAETALQESEARYRSLTDDVVEGSPVGIVILDSDCRVVWLNQAIQDYFSVQREAVLGKDYRLLVDQEIKHVFADPAAFAGRILATYEKKTCVERFECHVISGHEREERWLEHWSQPIRSGLYEGGRIEHYTDITARKNAEEAFGHLFYSSPIGIFIVQDRTFKLINPGFQETTGFSASELIGKDALSRVAPEFKETVRTHAIQMLRGERSLPFEFQIITKAGETRWIMETVTPIQYAGEEAILGHFMDITENKRLEIQLLQAQKMEAVGRLAGGVAHDFNNLLMAISGYGEILSMDMAKDDPLRSYTKEIVKAAEKAALLTRQLLAFSRKQILQPQEFNLNHIVTDIEQMLKRLIGEDVDLMTVLDPALGAIRADPGQIEQVIMNLAVNARDAMLQGGKLTIETANAFLDHAYAREHIEVNPGHYVMLAVSDSGIGMDTHTQSLIFEPFFTTKGPGIGTGLGLATVYGIVKQSGGHIWVYSEPGRGTTFKIYLPLVGEAVELLEVKRAPTTLPTGWESILVVEDEDALRALICEALQKCGYNVFAAHNGGEALAICRHQKGHIHLMLTDVVLPQMSGIQLAERLAPLCPDMKVIYMSGYTENTIVHHGVLDPSFLFLQKPFKVITLVNKVREVLDTG